jgi:hypothetical protein
MSGIVRSEHNGYEITGSVYSDGSIGWKCEALEKNPRWNGDSEEFSDYREIVKALDEYDLKCRKSFVNKAAYIVNRGWSTEKSSHEKVEVTSLTPNGKEAWVKTKEGKLRKLDVASLYDSEEGVRFFVKYLDETIAKFERDKQALQDALDKTRWVPKHE